MQCKFMPGDRLVVVNTGAEDHGIPSPLTLRELVTCKRVFLNIDGPAVLLHEHEPPEGFKGFRPILFEKAKDISIFHEIAERVTRKDKVDA